jgi:methionyl aminopeptidase
MDTTRECFFEGMKAAQVGARIGDIGHAVQQYAEDRGYSVVRQYIGHGVGEEMHEEPDVPNYGKPGRGLRLVPGMTIAIEPMINEGVAEVKTMSDGWTVKTADGKLSSHFENTIAIMEDGPVILTIPTQG